MGAFEIVGALLALALIGTIIWQVVSSRKAKGDAVDIMPGSMSGKELRHIPRASLGR
jgi:hypothetical protein